MLIAMLKLAQQEGVKTCLYSGYEEVDLAIRKHLDYLKTGPWKKALGGLDSPRTNQRFYDLRSETLLNVKFQ